jgi:hypothetical protein
MAKGSKGNKKSGSTKVTGRKGPPPVTPSGKGTKKSPKGY